MASIWIRVLILTSILTVTASCTGNQASRRTPSNEGTVLQTAGQRADPGYLQYLERQSMLGSETELSRVVSGSTLNWQRPASPPWPDVLLQLANSWLYLNPLTMLPEGKRPAFATLAGENFWRFMSASNVQGLYMAPTLGSGSIWAYNRKQTSTGNDSVQYGFSETAGKDDDYMRLLQKANTNRKFLGGDTVSAATGLGPDFFLAVRYQRAYPGAYCLIDVPKKLWGQLPTVDSQWHGQALTETQTQLLASQEIIPQNMRADTLSFGPAHGWAATGEIQGIDGQMRRWLYRFSGTPASPVLNWDDPTKAAQRILSGGLIQAVGLNGGALIGVRLDALYGLEASPATTQKQPPLMEPARSAAISLSREIRRYGGWAWLRDEMPLIFLRDVLYRGPDFAQDSVFSPGAEHALLTGDATLLRIMTDEALRYGVDARRLVHTMPTQDGISYALPHLSDIASRSGLMADGTGTPSGAPLGPQHAAALKTKILSEMRQKVASAKMTNHKGEEGVAPTDTQNLYTTSAGLVALSLGSGTAETVSKEQTAQILQGHMLLATFKALQPGLFILSGQDMAGVLPLSWWNMHDSAKEWDASYSSRGAYSLNDISGSVVVTQQGVAKAKTVYPPAELQIQDKASFVSRISRLIALRTRLTVAGGRIHGRFLTSTPGTIAMATILPAKGALPQQPDMHKDAPGQVSKPTSTSGGTVFHLSSDDGTSFSSSGQGGQKTQKDAEVHATISKRIRMSLAVPADPFTPGTSALITVFNFSRSTVTENLDLSASPALNRILSYGGPVLVTEDGGSMRASSKSAISVSLGPWQAAAIVIGR